MKNIILITILILFCFLQNNQPALAQAFDEVGFLDTLGKKKLVTVNDGLNLFELVINKKQPSQKADPKNNVPLKKGYIALLVADNLKLTDSVIYTLFKSERYAFRVCVAHNLLNIDGSEYDLMSGEELIEFLRLASEYKDKGGAK